VGFATLAPRDLIPGRAHRDGQVSYVELRRAGRRLAQQGAKTLAAQAEGLFEADWTEQELDALGRLLGRLTASLPGQLTAQTGNSKVPGRPTGARTASAS